MPTIWESDVVAGVYLVQPDAHGDDRGRFVETYRRSWFPAGREMVQANRSDKRAGGLVGLHFHLHQADYWYVTRGTALVVLHDLRRGSPTEHATLTLELGDDDERAAAGLGPPPPAAGVVRSTRVPAAGIGVFIPPGVAHGFAALTDLTLTYLVDQYYNPADELGVAWDDPDIGVDWRLDGPVVSERDRANPRRRDLPIEQIPHFSLRT